MPCISDFTTPCNGCGACYSACRNNAIDVRINNDGFYQAFTDDTKCSKCGICASVCYRSGYTNTIELTSGKVFAAQSNDPKVLLRCSSGGVAYEMAKYAYSLGHTVAGVIYDYDNHIAKTIVSDKPGDAEKFCGSKYVQSETSKAFRELLTVATRNPDKKCAVFGTPCQIYGLATATEHHAVRNNFVFVEIFCHGVPSYLVWNSYLDTVSKNRKDTIKNITFRDKSYGWHDYLITVEGEDWQYKRRRAWDLFYNAFLDGVLLNPACFDCKARTCKTKADVRLGDFWGKRYQKHEDGVSGVLILTETGAKFFGNLSSVTVLNETTVEELLYKQNLKKREDTHHKSAMEILVSTGDLKKTVRYYRKRLTLKQKIVLMISKAIELMPKPIRRMVRRMYQKILVI